MWYILYHVKRPGPGAFNMPNLNRTEMYHDDTNVSAVYAVEETTRFYGYDFYLW